MPYATSTYAEGVSQVFILYHYCALKVAGILLLLNLDEIININSFVRYDTFNFFRHFKHLCVLSLRKMKQSIKTWNELRNAFPCDCKPVERMRLLHLCRNAPSTSGGTSSSNDRDRRQTTTSDSLQRMIVRLRSLVQQQRALAQSSSINRGLDSDSQFENRDNENQEMEQIRETTRLRAR